VTRCPPRAAKVHNIRRAIDLLAALSPSAKPKRGLRPWTAEVADRLAELPAEELRLWQQLVPSIVVREQHRMPATWERVATAFIDEVGAGLAPTRLQEFWPARHAEVSLKHGGAQQAFRADAVAAARPRQQLAGRERCFYSRSRQRALSCHLRNVMVSVAGAINCEARRISCAARYL
jgi:hypothetical protein